MKSNWLICLAMVICLPCCFSGCARAFARDPARGFFGTSQEKQDKANQELKAGDHKRTLVVDGDTREFYIHVPPSYDKTKATPLVIAFHGLGLPASMMPSYTQLDGTADKHGFIVVYPAGSGLKSLSWNAGMRKGPFSGGRANDVKFTSEMIDELEKLFNIDKRRVFATGMSNGGMMCYRLANELSDRIAAIAPVSGTMTYSDITSKRPVPIIHFHGTDDGMVSYDQKRDVLGLVSNASVPETIAAWTKFDGCKSEPIETALPDKEADGTTVVKKDYGKGRDGSEVILYTINGGGHTWPGVTPPVKAISDEVLGLATFDISANELIWEFFAKHPMPEVAPGKNADKGTDKKPVEREL